MNNAAVINNSTQATIKKKKASSAFSASAGQKRSPEILLSTSSSEQTNKSSKKSRHHRLVVDSDNHNTTSMNSSNSSNYYLKDSDDGDVVDGVDNDNVIMKDAYLPGSVKPTVAMMANNNNSHEANLMELQRLLYVMEQQQQPPSSTKGSKNTKDNNNNNIPSQNDDQYSYHYQNNNWRAVVMRADWCQALFRSVQDKLSPTERKQLEQRVQTVCQQATVHAKALQQQQQQQQQQNGDHNTVTTTEYAVQRLFLQPATTTATASTVPGSHHRVAAGTRAPPSSPTTTTTTTTTTAPGNDTMMHHDGNNKHSSASFIMRRNKKIPAATSSIPRPPPNMMIADLQQAQREAVEDAIRDMAAQLKQETSKIHAHLETENAGLLEDMQQQAQTNVDDLTAVTTRVQEHVASNWRKSIGTWTLMFTLVGIFLFTLVTIQMVPKRQQQGACWFFCNRRRHQEQFCRYLPGGRKECIMIPKESDSGSGSGSGPVERKGWGSGLPQDEEEEETKAEEEVWDKDELMHQEDKAQKEDGNADADEQEQECELDLNGNCIIADDSSKSNINNMYSNIHIPSDEEMRDEVLREVEETRRGATSHVELREEEEEQEEAAKEEEPKQEEEQEDVEEVEPKWEEEQEEEEEEPDEEETIKEEQAVGEENSAAEKEQALEGEEEEEEEEAFAATPAMVREAAQSADLPLLRQLLQKHPEWITAADENGWAPLHLAVRAGHKDIVEYLLWEQTPYINVHQETLAGLTAIGIAYDRLGAQHDISVMLREAGDIPLYNDMPFAARDIRNAARHRHTAVLKDLLDIKPEWVNEGDENHWTALHEAARAGYFDVVSLLLAKGANVELRTKTGMTALDIARDRLPAVHPVVELLAQQQQ